MTKGAAATGVLKQTPMCHVYILNASHNTSKRIDTWPCSFHLSTSNFT